MDLGFSWAGWRHAFFAEIEPFGRAVLAARFPGVPIYSDVRDVPECGSGIAWGVTRDGADVGRAESHGVAASPDDGDQHGQINGASGRRLDVLTFGSPCQDLSVAGKRRGLDGDRSGLFWEAMRIAGDGPLRPRALLMENVEGLLSSNGGRDFAIVLDAMAERGYRWSYRVLDSQHFSVPQRRVRVFVLAIADDDPRAERIAEVLALGEGSGGDSSTSDPSWPSVAAGAGAGAPGSGGSGDAVMRERERERESSPPSRPSGRRAAEDQRATSARTSSSAPSGRMPHGDLRGAERPGLRTERSRTRPPERSPEERERERERSGGRERDHVDDPVRRGRLHGAGRAPDRAGGGVVSALQGGGERGHRVDAESAAGGHLIPVDGDGIISAPEVASTLQAQHGRGFAINAETADGQLVAFRKSARVTAVGGDIAHTLTHEGHDASEDGTGRGTPVVATGFIATGGSLGVQAGSVSPTLRVGSGVGIPSPPGVHVGPAVRRLTPLECERLQAWPEVDARGWTDIPWNGKEHAPDSKRYAACGNGVTSTVAYWIAARLAEVLRDD